MPLVDTHSLPAPSERPDLLVIAGEHSGDAHAARMVAAAKAKQPELNVCALGGVELERAGAQVLFDLTEHSVVGLFEVLKNYGFFKDLFEKTVTWIREHRPRAVCFVDYPGFNLRLAKRLVDEGLAVKGGGDMRLLYYISPQIWAWKTGRRFKMAQWLDALAVIFPFEVACYADTDLPVTFVGHPFVEPDARLPLQFDPDGPILLLPGSRQTPVRRILPVMLDGLLELRKQGETRLACVVCPDERIFATEEVILEEARDLLESHPVGLGELKLIQQGAGLAASAVLTSSGTMSLQVALAGVPGAIVYRANPLTYLVGRRVVKIEYLGIANILLERPAWPEFLQGAASPATLAGQVTDCLRDERRARQAQADAESLRAMLGEKAEQTPAEWLLTNLAV